MVNEVMSRLTNWWLKDAGNIGSSLHLSALLLKALMYGEVHSKGKR